MTETIMTMPALAVVGADHRIIRSTESFRRRYEDAETLCEQSPEIDQVLAGRVDVATMSLGDLSVEIEAVTDAAGRRQVMLTLPPQASPSSPEEPLAALRGAAEDSPAIVWVKDLDGRYLYANPRYGRELGTSPESLLGNTDADFPETETVDGPRLRYAEDGLKEPLQLEYTVPAIDSRPAMAAFRFPVRDEAGQPIGTCGVAAPTAEAQLARDEAVRLMQLERWNRLDPSDVRAEVLEQWHVQTASLQPDEADAAELEAEAEAEEAPEAHQAEPAPPESAEAAPAPDPPAGEQKPSAQRERAKETSRQPAGEPVPSLSETAELLQSNLELARKWADRAEQLQGELHASQLRIREAESEAQQALAAAARAAEEADRWRTELEETRVELEQAQAEAHAARSELDVTRGELGAARAQAESLRGPSAVALRLSEELGRALAAERERGDELDRTLARMRSRLTDFETALERAPEIPARSV